MVLVSGCNPNKTQIKLIDKETKEPIANANVQIQQILLCKMGAECHPPVLFEGKTDKNGMIYVKQEILKGKVNVLVDGYYLNSIFHDTKQTEPHNVYDEYVVVVDNNKFDIRSDIVIIELELQK